MLRSHFGLMPTTKVPLIVYPADYMYENVGFDNDSAFSTSV